MKLIFLALFAVLFSCNCSSGFVIDQNGDGIEANQGDKVSPNFIDLDPDVLYIILSKMELQELSNTAEAIPQLFNLISEVFRREFSKNNPLIKVNINTRYDSDQIGHEMEFVDNEIVINDTENCIKMFKNFGHFLQNVAIMHRTTNISDVNIVNHALNRYCSESLKKLQWSFDDIFRHSGVTVLDEITQWNPFNEVEEFFLDIPYGPGIPRPLNELFPNLRRLELKLNRDVNISFINGHFPLLNHFQFMDSYYVYKENEEFDKNLKGMIMKNPTIRSIEFFQEESPNFLKFLSEALPNLQHLSIYHMAIDEPDYLISESDTVRFENVKSFDVRVRFPSGMKNFERLSLPHLESLYTWYSVESFDDLISFFKRHTQLKQLNLVGFSNLFRDVSQLNDLVTALPNLVDLTITTTPYNGIESIAQFMQNKSHLEKIQLKFTGFLPVPTAEFTALQQRLQHEWTITPVERIRGDNTNIVGLIFEQKQFN